MSAERRYQRELALLPADVAADATAGAIIPSPPSSVEATKPAAATSTDDDSSDDLDFSDHAAPRLRRELQEARTALARCEVDFVMAVDVDFVPFPARPSARLRRRLTELGAGTASPVALVLAAFEEVRGEARGVRRRGDRHGDNRAGARRHHARQKGGVEEWGGCSSAARTHFMVAIALLEGRGGRGGVSGGGFVCVCVT